VGGVAVVGLGEETAGVTGEDTYGAGEYFGRSVNRGELLRKKEAAHMLTRHLRQCTVC
jgi:hypothetical protein